jgi:hypothetical protein
VKRSQLNIAFAVACAGAVFALAGTASAAPEVRNLGHGWQLYIADADMVDISVDALASNASTLVIEKFVTHTSSDPIDLVFTQTASNALTATRLIIADEYISNRSGSDWVTFSNALINQVNGSAAWNTTASSGLSIAPFTQVSYSLNNTAAEFSGGTVIDQAFWFPGVATGALVMDVILNAADSPEARTSITLRSAPATIPTPGAGALVLVGGSLLVTRRRR